MIKSIHVMYSCTTIILIAQISSRLLSASMVTPVSSTSGDKESSALDGRSDKISLRNRRQTLEGNEIFICDISYRDGLFAIYLICDRLLKCRVDTYGRRIWSTVELPPMNRLSDNCSEVTNPFISHHSGDESFDTYYVLQGQIKEMTLKFNLEIILPPGYFCGLKNVTSMTFCNVLYSAESLGFSESCSSSECCVCNLKHLNISFNLNLEVIRNSIFCGMQNLTTLILQDNAIAEIEDNAFSYLQNLERLELQRNILVNLSKDLFGTSKIPLKYLDASYNKLNNELLCSLQTLTLLEELKLNLNCISVLIGDCIKGLTSLKRLNLYGNKITTLGEEFHFLTSLEELDVSKNSISSVNRFPFHHLVNLTVLKLSENHFPSIIDFISSDNYRLNVLDVTENEFTTIPPKLKYIKNLTQLFLAQNKIESITESDKLILCNITNLQYLSLDHNRIRHIEPRSFECQTNLKNLSLKFNYLTTIAAMKFSEVTHLYVQFNEINNISLEELPSHLVHLDANHNRIKEFHFSLQNSVPPERDRVLIPNLQYLDLSHNIIRNISIGYCSSTEGMVLTTTKTLSYGLIYKNNCLPGINLNFNSINSVCPLILKMTQKTTLPVVEIFYSNLLCQCEVDYLLEKYDSSFVNRRTLSSPSPKCHQLFDPTGSQSIIRSLDEWNLLEQFTCTNGFFSSTAWSSTRGCSCNTHPDYYKVCELPCPNYCNCYIGKRYDLYLIDCSNLSFSSLPHVEQIYLTKIVILSGNQLSTLNASVLSPYTRAIRLDFDNNYLRNIASKTFHNFEQLKILNLKNNLLSEIEYETFLGLRRLKELDLSNNRLVNVHQGAFLALASVQNLTLRNNKLNEISTSELSNLKSLHVQGIDLASNPWSCDCDFAHSFRGWLENSSSLVKEAETLYCLQNDSRISLITFNNSDCYYVQARIIRINDIATWTSVVSVVTFITVLTIVIYLYRKEMQVLIYSRYGIRLFQKKEDVDVNKTYDVFIAYSSLDEAFVVEHLLPGLEEIEKPYKVCIHHRNFMAGAIITESILEAVEASSRTIVVLSENFVQSGFCRFEFKSAHLQMFIDKSTRIIVLLLGKIPNNLDPEMKLYLKTNTYLEWGDRLFWEKLYFALPDKTQHRHSTLELQ